MIEQEELSFFPMLFFPAPEGVGNHWSLDLQSPVAIWSHPPSWRPFPAWSKGFAALGWGKAPCCCDSWIHAVIHRKGWFFPIENSDYSHFSVGKPRHGSAQRVRNSFVLKPRAKPLEPLILHLLGWTFHPRKILPRWDTQQPELSLMRRFWGVPLQ